MPARTIGIYAVGGKYPPQSTISGHIQVAFQTARHLMQNGYNVTLITSEAPPDYQLPPIAPEGLPVITITSAAKRWPANGIYVNNAGHQFLELRQILSSNQFDLIHFFGANHTAYLLGLLKLSGVSTPMFLTLTNFKYHRVKPFSMITKILLSQADQIITLTMFIKQKLNELGLKNIRIMRPGITTNYSAYSYHKIDRSEHLVLFWRNADRKNGADICAEVFKRLTEEYPNTKFIFAVRPGDEYESILQKVSESHKHIYLMTYPYEDRITIESLLASASIVILPFRELTINPQFAVLETLASGTPLITTSIESNKELIAHNKTGLLITPPNIEEICSCVRKILDNPSYARRIGKQAKSYIEKKWNWDIYEKELLRLYQSLEV